MTNLSYCDTTGYILNYHFVEGRIPRGMFNKKRLSVAGTTWTTSLASSEVVVVQPNRWGAFLFRKMT